MDFLEKLDFTQESVEDFLEATPEKLVNELNKQKKLVTENINYLKNLGINNYQEIFIKYPDMFLMDFSNFQEVFSKYEVDDLIEKLNKNISIVEFL